MKSMVTGISSMATRDILQDLTQRYEQVTGSRAVIESMGGVDAARLVRAGNAYDIVVLASSVIAELEAERHIVPGSVADIVSSGMAMAIREGAIRPDISDGEAVKRAIMAARKICYSSGPSGDYLLKLCERWGLWPSIAERMIKAPPGVPVGKMVAQGDADLGFQQFSELMHLPGIDIVGQLPPDVQLMTVFSAGVCTTSSSPEAAGALIAFLISPEAESEKRKHGMEPA